MRMPRKIIYDPIVDILWKVELRYIVEESEMPNGIKCL